MKNGTIEAPQTVQYAVRHTTTYRYSEAVPVCHNEIHLVPRALPRQRVTETALVVEPAPAGVSSSIDYFGNTVGFFSIEEAHEQLVVAASSRVAVDTPPPWTDLPDIPWEQVRDAMGGPPRDVTVMAREFVCESPLVRSASALAEWASSSFAPGRPWADALLDLTRRIHRDFVYDPTATTTSTPVEDVFSLRRGVCQDFAHLQIACLRSLGLAARYVSGYLCNERRVHGSTGEGANDAGMVGADASHAWLACWGGPEIGWIDVDPTNDCPAGVLHVTVAWGRDYGDVSPVKGVCVGGGTHVMDVAVHVRRTA